MYLRLKCEIPFLAFFLKVSDFAYFMRDELILIK